MKENKEQDAIQEKVTLGEKISLGFRKSLIVNNLTTLLLFLILIMGYVCINLWTKTVDLPEIDLTENKIYTLSDASKNAVSNIDQDITIYAYGFEEKGSLIKLLKQYHTANERINYEILTEESNYNMVQEYDLKAGYYILILKSGEFEKVIDASTDFTTYDYTTYQSIDTTEQVITNSILSLNITEKPKIYFLQGHSEYAASALQVLQSYLKNEAFDVADLNLVTTGGVPEDCDILAILSPTQDFIDTEAQFIKDYINRGGKIYFSLDVVAESNTSLPNLQSVLDEYGVSVQNGYIMELADNQSMAEYPYIFMPQVSGNHKITQDIYTDSYMWLVYSARLNYKDAETLESLNVEKETLLSSSDKALFITDLASDFQTASQTGEQGICDIASVITKTIDKGEEGKVESKLVVSASGSFISDYKIPQISETYPLSYLGSNKDFAINSMSFLSDKGNSLTIRKDMANSTYTPTKSQNQIVVTLIFVVPLVIIAIGIIISVLRKRRK